MKRTFVASLFLLVLSLISNTASALTSTCGFLYAPPLGQTTAAHRADWNLYSYPYDDWIDMYTYITAPNGAGGALQSYRANTLGSQIHYWINVVDGNYTVYGDNYEYYYGQTSGCSWAGTRNTTPPPTVSVSATPSTTVVIGTPIRITWSSTNATSCTYNGGQTIPITSGTSTNGYYEWTPNAAGSNTYTITCTGAGGTGSANVTTTYTLPSVSITTAAGVIGYISTSPAMPSISFQATTSQSSIPLSTMTFKWFMELKYTEHGKNFVNRIPASGTYDVLGSGTWSPSFGGLLAGANDIVVHVSVLIGSQTTPVVTKSGFQIHGTNPTQAQIFSMATSLESKAVAWQESTHRQFAGTRYSGTGLPLWGPPDGWGLMQRDPLQSEAQLWNWQTSLSLGLTWLTTVRNDAQSYLNTWYAAAQSTPDPNDNWSWNPATQNADWVWDDGFSRYNTGSPIFSPNGNGGVKNCSANSAGCSYATTIRGHMNNPPW
jgi:hypothetical protein